MYHLAELAKSYQHSLTAILQAKRLEASLPPKLDHMGIRLCRRISKEESGAPLSGFSIQRLSIRARRLGGVNGLGKLVGGSLNPGGKR